MLRRSRHLRLLRSGKEEVSEGTKNENQTRNTNCVDLVAKIADGHVVGSRDREEGRLRRRRSGRILGSIEGLEGQLLKLFKQCRNQPRRGGAEEIHGHGVMKKVIELLWQVG